MRIEELGTPEGGGRSEVRMELVSIDKMTPYACADATVLCNCVKCLQNG